MYHGTHSMFCPFIEQQGFCFDSFEAAYSEEVRTIITACDELLDDRQPAGYAAAKGFSDKNWVYFSVHFKVARRYASNVGGERIDGALQAANAFLAFARDKHRVELQAAHWEGVLKQYGRPHLPTERVLANLQNADLVRKLTEQVEHAYSVLTLATKEGHPVVYAVRADLEWLREAGVRDIQGFPPLEPLGGIPLAAVSADRIVARIDYANGISPESRLFHV
jgi:hypothetical protein